MSEKGNVAEQTLRELLSKTSHPLLEVRTRSLRSLSLKLRSGLVSAESLVHEQVFLSSLLQWFNFPEWGSEQLPLGLLDLLAEYEVAAVGLVEMGAVEFLSQLRLHCNSSLHPTIDSVLEKLLRIPPSLLPPSPSGKTERTANGPPNLPLYPADEEQGRENDARVVPDSQLTPCATETNSQQSRPSLSTTSQTPCSLASLPLTLSLAPGTTTTALSSPPQLTPSSLPTSSGAEQQLRRPHSLQSATAPTTRPEEERERGRNGGRRVFPWLRLSLNDINILRTTENHLLSGQSIQDHCQFIEDVLFQDFPVEVFLQRPSLLRVLISLLDSERGAALADLPCICHCLSQLNHRLTSRTCLLEMTPADHFTVKDIHISACAQTGLTTAMAELTNQNHWRESHDLERLTQDMLVHLESSEVTLDNYCSLVVRLSTDRLTNLLSKAGVEREGGTRSDPTSALTATLHLLASAVDLFEAYGRCGVGERGRGEEEGDRQAVENISSALSHSLALWRHVSNKSTPGHARDSTHHQLACRVSISLTSCLLRTLFCSAAAPSLSSLPSVLEVLRDVAVNGVVMVATPGLHHWLTVFLEESDPATYQAVRGIKKLYETFKSMSSCLKMSSRGGSELEATPTSLSARKELELATAALPGLWAFCNSEFVGREVSLSLSILKDEKREMDWTAARSLLLQLLAHDSPSVQTAAYNTFTAVLTSTTPFSLPPSLGEEFLDLLCCHALFSPLDDVIHPAATILGSSLSAARVQKDCWLRDSLIHRLPYIEVSLGGDEEFFKEMCEFIESEVVPERARLHSLLRLTFSSDKRRREYGCAGLIKLCALPSSPPPPACDLLTACGPSQHPFVQKTNLERSDAVQLLNIVRSPVMDDLLKRSALQQLATLLTDALLHTVALEEGTLSTVLHTLKLKLNLLDQEAGGGGVNKDRDCEGDESAEGGGRRGGEGEKEPRGFWKACAQCLQLLALTSSEVRRQLSEDDRFLLGLFSACVRGSSDQEFLQISSALLASLVFSDVSLWTSDHIMQLPEPLLNKLKLTCPVGSYPLENLHQTPQILTPSQLPSPHTLSLLYYLAMAGGSLKQLLENHSPTSSSKEGRREGDEREAATLSLQPGDLESLRYLWPPSGLRECLSRFCDARSHSEVSFWLDHLTLISHCCHVQCGVSKTPSERERSSLVSCEPEESCSKDWEEVFGRFLQVKPATAQDKDLLSHLLLSLSTLLDQHHRYGETHGSSVCLAAADDERDNRGKSRYQGELLGARFLSWLVEQTAGEETMCQQTLRSLLQSQGDHEDHRERKLERALIHFYISLSPHLSRLLPPSHHPTSSNRRRPPSSGSLSVHCLEQRLAVLHTLSLGLTHLTVTQHNCLSSLHGCLQILTHLTAGLCWCTGDAGVLESCTNIASTLKQMVCSVVAGRGEMLASFMGQGLLQKASLTLSLIARGVASTNHPHNWFSETFSSTKHGFGWLNHLTHCRDPQVRCAGYSLLASVCGERGSGERLAGEWAPHQKFGLWGAMMGVAVDRSEWVRVRQQAVEVLVAASGTSQRDGVWEQLLTFRDQQQTLTGEAAMEVFLRESSPLQLLLAPDDPDLTTPLLRLISNLTLSFPLLLRPRLEPLGDTLLRYCDPVVASSTVDLPPAATTGPLSPSLLLSCRSTLDLLHVAIAVGSKVILDLLLSGDNTLRLAQLLALWGRGGVGGERDSDGCGGGGLEVCESLLRLLLCLREKSPPELAHVVPTSLLSHWTSFTAILRWSLLPTSPHSTSPSLLTLSLSLLHSLLRHKLHPPTPDINHASFNEKLTSLLDHVIETECESCPPSSGAELCAALLEVYEGSEVKLMRQKGCGLGAGLVSKVLCVLLASSQSAKQTALKGGLLEMSVEVVRGLHSQMVFSDSQKPHSSHSHRNKEPPQVSQISERLAVIRSLLYQSPQLKTAAEEGPLLPVLAAMWPWCTISGPLARAVLDTLIVFTARNSRGRAALATSTRGSESLLYKIAGHASHCLSSHRSCVAARSATSPLSLVLSSSMTLAANCSLSPEGRRVLKKAAFLDNFTSLSLPPPKSSSSSSSSSSAQTQVVEAALWVKTLVNFTFSSDGQQTVMKLPGVVDQLVDLYHRPDMVQPSLCLLALRNLCFCSPTKTLLLENERFVCVLANGLEGRQELWTRAVAASAVWALTHNCAKIRKILRGTGDLVEKMTHLHSSLSLQQRATTTSPPPPLSSLLHLYSTNLSNAVQTLGL